MSEQDLTPEPEGIKRLLESSDALVHAFGTFLEMVAEQRVGFTLIAVVKGGRAITISNMPLDLGATLMTEYIEQLERKQ